MEKVRLGIIGMGNMGSGHAKNLMDGKVPEIEITAVADRKESRRQWCKENLPENVKIFEEGKDLIAAEDVCDAVLINKIDVLPYFDFDMELVKKYIHQRNPKAEIFPVSAKTGEGIEAWTTWLKKQVTDWKS